ncbi:MAG: hypothetical protein Kow0063_34460 [Anaerolineae bacterium]
MNPSKQKRRQWQERLRQVQSKLEEYRLPPEDHDADAPPGSKREWRDLVEQRIQEAMTAGVFDNLPGKGKPLNLIRNPYLDPSLELAYGLLKNNGYAPEWIALDKEIRQELEVFRTRLGAAWTQQRANPVDEATWQTTLTRFEATLAQINRKIDDLNLLVPVISCQRARIRLVDELQRLVEESPSPKHINS